LKKLLPLFSYVFHPVFISVYATIIYLFLKGSYFVNQEKLYVLSQVVIITVLIPILFFLILKSYKKIDSVMLYEVSQRKIPLVLECFLIIFLVKKFIVINHYPELHFYFLGCLLSTLLALLLLFANIKASLHILAISSLTLFAAGLSLHLQSENCILISFLIFMAGFVATSRLEMKAHTFKELTIGLFLGSTPQLLLWCFWL
jgi:hypothetical protein